VPCDIPPPPAYFAEPEVWFGITPEKCTENVDRYRFWELHLSVCQVGEPGRLQTACKVDTTRRRMHESEQCEGLRHGPTSAPPPWDLEQGGRHPHPSRHEDEVSVNAAHTKGARTGRRPWRSLDGGGWLSMDQGYCTVRLAPILQNSPVRYACYVTRKQENLITCYVFTRIRYIPYTSQCTYATVA
jgi:hypothetical protein